MSGSRGRPYAVGGRGLHLAAPLLAAAVAASAGCARPAVAPEGPADPSGPYRFTERRADPVVLLSGRGPGLLTQVAEVANLSDAPLSVVLRGKSCTCASLSVADSPDAAGRDLTPEGTEVHPGGVIYLTLAARFTGEPGTHGASAAFEFRGPGGVTVGSEVIRLRYQVLPPLSVTPHSLAGTFGPGDSRDVPIRLTVEANLPADEPAPGPPVVSHSDGPLRSLAVAAEDPADLAGGVRRYRWLVTGVLGLADGPGGVAAGTIAVGLAGRPDAARAVYRYEVRGTLLLQPPSCSLGVVGPDTGPVTKVFFVTAAGGEPFELSAVEVPVGVTASYQAGPAARHRLSLTFHTPGKARAGDNITIRTTFPGGAEFRLPVTFASAP